MVAFCQTIKINPQFGSFMQEKTSDQRYSQAQKLLSQGDATTAIRILKELIEKQPDFYSGWLLLSNSLYQQGLMQEAVSTGNKAEQFDPLQAEFRNIQARMQVRAFTDAENIARQMLAKVQGHPRAIFTLSHIATITNNVEESASLLKEGLSFSPANLMLRHKLIDSQVAIGDFACAIDNANALVAIEESFDTFWVLICLLLKFGQHGEILDACERAEHYCGQDKGKLSQLNLVRGQTLRIIGQRQQSINAFHASLAANPNNGEAWWGLADMKNYGFTEDEISALKTLVSNPGIAAKNKSVVTFALAKAVESNQGISQAMDLYHQANRLHPSRHADPSRVDKDFKALAKTYSPQSLSIQADIPGQQATPIFIVGLPRSGSTLVEQILASHSQVEGTLEQPTMFSVERRAQALCAGKFNASLSDSLEHLSAADLAELGQAYLHNGRIFRRDNKAFFTDKLPFNFRQIGLIHKILPNAVIIDVRRNPLDCGLSLYKQYFVSGVDFSYDLHHIGAFYNAYLALMDYWDSVLPGKVLRVQYEELVGSPEQQIRSLLNHAGLEFEADCLAFHKTSRVVHTASSEQVRQPINSKGIGLWRNVESALQPLKDSLGNEILTASQRF